MVSAQPPAVRTAVRALWASLWLAVVIVALTVRSQSLGEVIFAAGALALVALLVAALSARHNWARLTLIIVSVTGLPISLALLFQNFPSEPVVGVVSAIQQGLVAWACVLLWRKEARTWYRSARPNTHSKRATVRAGDGYRLAVSWMLVPSFVAFGSVALVAIAARVPLLALLPLFPLVYPLAGLADAYGARAGLALAPVAFIVGIAAIGRRAIQRETKVQIAVLLAADALALWYVLAHPVRY